MQGLGARAQGDRARGEGGEATRAAHLQEATCAAAAVGGATEEVSLALLHRSKLMSSPSKKMGPGVVLDVVRYQYSTKLCYARSYQAQTKLIRVHVRPERHRAHHRAQSCGIALRWATRR